MAGIHCRRLQCYMSRIPACTWSRTVLAAARHHQFLAVAGCMFVQQHNYNRIPGHSIHVPDKKMGLAVEQQEDIPTVEYIREGLDVMREGIPKFKQEMIDKFSCDMNIIAQHMDFEYLVEFDGKKTFKDWVVSADSDLHRGKSKANLDVSPSNKALFHGFINTDKPPKDGFTRQLGFCNLRSPLNKKSFERIIPYDWGRYTHMYLKVRGDGRNYMLNLQMDRYFDTNWHDLYHYPLYTRGGPYWQLIKVPFTHFYLGSGGRIQDRQEMLSLNKVHNCNISVMDGVAGSFQLEIDFIALVRDENAETEFAYELYEKSPYDM